MTLADKAVGNVLSLVVVNGFTVVFHGEKGRDLLGTQAMALAPVAVDVDLHCCPLGIEPERDCPSLMTFLLTVQPRS